VLRHDTAAEQEESYLKEEDLTVGVHSTMQLNASPSEGRVNTKEEEKEENTKAEGMRNAGSIQIHKK